MRPVAPPVVVAVASLVLLAACSSDTDSDPKSSSSPSAVDSSAPADAPPSADPSSSAADLDIVDNPPTKTWQEALAAAQDEFSGDVTKIELEQQKSGGLEYKIELVSTDSEYEVQFDADTLAKLSEDRDDLDKDDAAEERRKIFDPASLIGLDEAASAARQQQDGAIGEWKIEGKDTGRVQYEFDIRPAGASHDVEVQIDAKDGSLIADS